MDYPDLLSFYQGKKVLITGNTGFKGSWLTKILLKAGAVVTGYSLKPPTTPSLFHIAEIENHPHFTQVIGDIRNLEYLKDTFLQAGPEIVFHLAAQPIVTDSYRDPVGTYSTNVMGTVHVLDSIRTISGIRSFVNVTTDKVYKNNEWEYGYREYEPLDGFDPYSNSKSCSELVTHCYRSSFFSNEKIGISTVRAGNVIGGGDFANNRIIPDSVRAVEKAFRLNSEQAVIPVRNPYSIRPYQHVLEPLQMYLLIAMRQYEDIQYSGSYNVGPDDSDCITTGDLADLFCIKWNRGEKNRIWPAAIWENGMKQEAPHEARILKLDNSKIKSVFGWKPVWNIEKCIEETVRFTKKWLLGENIAVEMEREIEEFFSVKKQLGGRL